MPGIFDPRWHGAPALDDTQTRRDGKLHRRGIGPDPLEELAETISALAQTPARRRKNLSRRMITMKNEIGLEERIAQAVEDKLEDGSVERAAAAAVESCIHATLSDLCGYNGVVRKALKENLGEILCQRIEEFDFRRYVIKLDEILTEIVNNTVASDNKAILENFRDLMLPRKSDRVTLSSLFDVYCEMVKSRADVGGYDTEEDEDNGDYVPVTASMVCKRSYESCFFKYKTVSFTCAQDVDLNLAVELRQDFDSTDAVCNTWFICHIWNGQNLNTFPDGMRIDSLRSLDKFQLALWRMRQDRTEVELDQDSMEKTLDILVCC